MKLKTFLRLLGPVIFIIIILFFIDWRHLKEILFRVKWHYLVVSFLLSLILLFIRSLRWQKILNRLKIIYPISKAFKIYLVETVAVILTSTIGTFVKAFYLKKDGYGIRKPVLSVIADKYFDYLVPIILGIASIALITLKIQTEVSLVILAVIASILFYPAIIFITIFEAVYSRIPAKMKAFFERFNLDIRSDFGYIRSSLSSGIYFLSLTGSIMWYLVVFSLCKGLSIDLKFSEIVLIESFATVVTIIPIGFMGLGTRDAALMAGFRIFGHPFEEAIALSMTMLFLRLIFLLVGAIFWFMDPPALQQNSD